MDTQQDTSYNRLPYGTSVRKSKTMQEDSKQSHPTQQAQDSKQPLESSTAQSNPTNPIESSLDSSFMNDSNHIESTATKTTQSTPMDSNHTESNHPATQNQDKHKAQILALKHTLKTDSKKAAQKEQFVLKVSMYSALILAIFGISFGIFVKSMAVIFDGFVALISVGLGALSVITSRYIYKEDDDIFQYGYVRFEPMVNLFKSLVLVFVCVYAFINALQSIIHGGYAVELGGAVAYSLCAFVFCAILFVYTLFYTRLLESDLIKVDNTEWKIDCVLYLGALGAFGVIYFVLSPKSALAMYVDPLLLAVLSLMLCVSPIRIAIANFKDLIMVAPSEIDSKITQIMESLSKDFGFSNYDTHVAKSGRFYMVEVNILIDKNCKISSVAEFDSVRDRIEKSLDIPSYKIWLSVSFTGNAKWL